MILPAAFLTLSLIATVAAGWAGYVYDDDKLMSVAISAFGIDLACLLFFI